MKGASSFFWRRRSCPDWRVGARGAHVLLTAACLFVLPTGIVAAQQAGPTISVSPTISAERAAQTQLVIRVVPPEAASKGSFIRIRGLPATVALSEGYSISPGSWAIPIAGLPNLKLTLPASAVAKAEMVITLVNTDGTVLAEAKSTLMPAAQSGGLPEAQARRKERQPAASILRADVPAQPSPGQAQPPLAAAPLRRGMTEQQRERALRLLTRGNEHLSEGGIAQARLLYERAAEAGLPQAALALGATYDPVELQQLGVHGLKPDRERAMRWYERASQLGAPEAEGRLRRLSAN